MPSLADHQSNDFTKILLCGDSGSGKSGCLTSLVRAGYKLRILDMDNSLDSLKTYVLHDCPDKIGNVEFRTLRDTYITSASGPTVAKPKAFVDAMKMLDKWKYDEVDLGNPAEFGPDAIVVVDSLSFLSDAAFDWAKGLNPGAKDPRQWYGSAQEAIESALALLTSPNFRTNVIVISHIKYIENPDGTRKGYPNSVGSALGPTIPRYFNNWVQCENKSGKRSLITGATSMLDLKNVRPFDMAKSYPIDTGLADIFGVIRGAPKIDEVKPKPALRKV
jgi:hypothetical protein